ncbi:ECF-type sigma factor [Stieleria sp. TO1_6]|uniref:ECF-type sigma factor n=1 Tax=Stieleria tagensis TaxID=2956795 RepID=UPI00209B725B|nr:ECF-type sigma factor [Stieleria tagensis]MCO8122982.1 ECF-type sigma factor [Stieleria tagensis]
MSCMQDEQKNPSEAPGISAAGHSDAERFSAALDRVRCGDDQAIAELWNGYFQRLVRLAAKRLPSNLKRAGDEEDIALSAFHSFIAGIRRDQFPDLSGPDNLWGLLITLTGRKVNAHLRFQTRQKRGGGSVRGESVFMDPSDAKRSVGIGGVSGAAPTADLKAELEEACERLLNQLPDDQLRQIAVMRMDGFLVDEIADRLGLSKRATERRLQLIRRTWTEEAHYDEDESDHSA